MSLPPFTIDTFEKLKFDRSKRRSDDCCKGSVDMNGWLEVQLMSDITTFLKEIVDSEP